MERIIFEVDGREYGGMESVTVSRSITSAAGVFSVSFTELWPGRDEAWPIQPHTPVRVLLGSSVLINGYVDKLPIEIGPDRHVLRAAGRDRTGQIMDCDPHPSPGEYRNIRIDKLARALTRRLGLEVVVDASASGMQAIDVVRPAPGQSIYRLLEEQARKDNVLIGCTTDGSLRLFRPGGDRAAVSLVYGRNVKSAVLDNDWSDRFSCYLVEGQSQGFDTLPGPASQVRGESRDASVTLDRLKRMRADSAMDAAAAAKRASWEATTRAARSISLTIPMRGWRQDPDSAGSSIWREGLLVPVDIPPLKISEDLLIESVDYGFDSASFGCSLRLTRPDAWKPEPPKPEKDPLTGEGWPDLYG